MQILSSDLCEKRNSEKKASTVQMHEMLKNGERNAFKKLSRTI